jgi:autoinducer 2-degrading protein
LSSDQSTVRFTDYAHYGFDGFIKYMRLRLFRGERLTVTQSYTTPVSRALASSLAAGNYAATPRHLAASDLRLGRVQLDDCPAHEPCGPTLTAQALPQARALPAPSRPHPALMARCCCCGSGGVSASLDSSGPVSEMVPVLVEVEVKPERLDEFLEVMRQDAVGSRTEPGCLRFDVMQDQENPCKFVFYEVYKDAAAAAAHRDYPHFKLWTDFKVCATWPETSAARLPAAACRPLTRCSSDRPTAWCPPCRPSPSSHPGASRPMAPTESEILLRTSRSRTDDATRT